MNINEINKFPMGTHKQQCIGPCFPENTVLINPLTLVMGEADKPSCSVLPWNNNGKIEHFDNCDNPIDKKDVEQISLNYVVPIVHFNCEYFFFCGFFGEPTNDIHNLRAKRRQKYNTC